MLSQKGHNNGKMFGLSLHLQESSNDTKVTDSKFFCLHIHVVEESYVIHVLEDKLGYVSDSRGSSWG